jgi:hypothetical protein
MFHSRENAYAWETLESFHHQQNSPGWVIFHQQEGRFAGPVFSPAYKIESAQQNVKYQTEKNLNLLVNIIFNTIPMQRHLSFSVPTKHYPPEET